MGNSGAPIGCCSSETTDESSAAIVEQSEAVSNKEQKSVLKGTTEAKLPAEVVSSPSSPSAAKIELERKGSRAKSWSAAELQSKAEVQTFTVRLVRPSGKETSTRLGLDIDYAEENNSLPIVEINGGLAGQWNAENPRTVLRMGDSIVAVNGIGGDISKMLKACSTSSSLELLVVRGTSEETGVEVVASGLLAADAYFNKVLNQKLANTTSGKDAVGDASSGEEAAKQPERRASGKKRTLTWALRS